jgi:hypothetical protein
MQGTYIFSELLSQIIHNNFLSNAGEQRTMPALRMSSIRINDFPYEVNFLHENALNALLSVLSAHQGGLRMRYNTKEKTYDLSFSMTKIPDERNVLPVFSRGFNNVADITYNDGNERLRNVAYAEHIIYNNHLFSGIERREMGVRPARDVLPTLAAARALESRRSVRFMTCNVNPHNQQYVYLKDWDVGSAVRIMDDDIGFDQYAWVSGVTESHGPDGVRYGVDMQAFPV